MKSLGLAAAERYAESRTAPESLLLKALARFAKHVLADRRVEPVVLTVCDGILAAYKR